MPINNPVDADALIAAHAALPDVHHVAFVAADHTAIGDAAPHHAEAHTLASHSTKAHSELTGVTTSQHHVKYTNAEAIAAAKTDPTLLNYTQGARVYNNANQAIATSTIVTLAFNSERYDTDSIHNTVTNNSRLTCKTAGKYLIVASFEWETNATNRRAVWIWLNGVTTIAQAELTPGGAGFFCNTPSCIYDLAVGDFVVFAVWQNSGVSLNIIYTANYSPEFMMQRIG